MTQIDREKMRTLLHEIAEFISHRVLHREPMEHLYGARIAQRGAVSFDDKLIT